MMYPLVRDLAAEGIPVVVTCRVLGFSPQAFYQWGQAPCSPRDRADAQLTNAIVDVHADDPEFGYRFIADELHAAGHQAGERRVWRLCSQHRVFSRTTRKGRTASGRRPGPAVHDDLVQRNFTAPRPNTLWLTDITEHPTAEGKLYLCAIKDGCSHRIVGYAVGAHMTARLATAALRAALARRRPGRVVVVHSDRGSQFRSRLFRAALKAAGLKGSMGRVAAAGDNAAMESFFSLLQKNVLNRHGWATRDQLHTEIVYWIEHTYHRRRRQRALGKLTPIEYELAFDPDEDVDAA
jgi:transposase InsO family protein